MSLSALSTEIDELIIQQLPRCALHSLTLTSKYYRELAEPLLYKEIKVHNTSTYSIARLTWNLLARRELARYIWSFGLVYRHRSSARADDPETESPSGRLEDIHEELFKRRLKAKDTKEDLVEPLRDPQLTLERFISSFGTREILDVSISMILVMATNLEHLQISGLHNNTLYCGCWERWQEGFERSYGKAYPIHKLKSLELDFRFHPSIPLLPPTESLKVSSRGIDLLYRLPHQKPITIGAVCSLELQDICMTQHDIEKMISLPQMRCIKHLKMVRIDSRASPIDDCRRLSDFLLRSLPALKTLLWTGEDNGSRRETSSPFGSSCGLTQLEELTLGYKYIIPWGVHGSSKHLLHPEAFLPVSLKALTIKNLSGDVLLNLRDESAASPMNNYLLGTAKYLGLSRFDLYIHLPWSQPSPDYMQAVLEFLPELVSSLDDVGTSMRIYNYMARDSSKLLCARGYRLMFQR